MCTIIGGRLIIPEETNEGGNEKCRKNYILGLVHSLSTHVFTKGGDYISILVISKDDTFQATSITWQDSKRVFDTLVDYLVRINQECDFLIFSRLTPEMENTELENIEFQPYRTILGDNIIVHGTIQIPSDMKGINIDTELLKYQTSLEESIKIADGLNGKVAIIKRTKDGKIEAIQNGLGLYEYQDNIYCKLFSNINIENSNNTNRRLIKIREIDPYKVTTLKFTSKENSSEWDILSKSDSVRNKISHRRMVALYSGGLDISSSVLKYLNDADPDVYIASCDLLYFDWNTLASNAEIFAGYLMEEHLSKTERGDVKHHVLKIDSTFNDLLNVCGLNTTRLMDTNAVGEGLKEAESAFSYVPVRNSILINFAVAWAEQRYPNENVDIIIGANLSEGMIYADNSTAFIDAKNKEIKYIGQKTAKFNLIAPFKNVTKTKMIQDLIEIHEFYPELSFSCYFPKMENEKIIECGECGSCLLRREAIKRATNKGTE